MPTSVFLPESVRLLYTLITPASNSGTGETTVATYTLSGNTLNRNGQALRITVLGDFAANSDTKTVRVKLGATSLFAQTSTSSGSGFGLIVYLFRLTSGTEVAKTIGNIGSTLVSASSGSASIDLTAATTITVTLQSDTQSSDATLKAATIELLPAGPTVV